MSIISFLIGAAVGLFFGVTCSLILKNKFPKTVAAAEKLQQELQIHTNELKAKLRGQP